MNIYGDTGNIKALIWRLNQRDTKAKVIKIGIDEVLPKSTDILVAGGGQDSGQEVIQADLKERAIELQSLADEGVPMLVVCGMYQLFGHYFKTAEGTKIQGLGIFDAVTEAGPTRMIGNIVVQSPFGRLVGFENHSGQTVLAEDQLPLGKVVKGSGNNGSTGKEGAVYKNVFGTYLHGPVLPKNPRLADEIIRRAIERKYGKQNTGLVSIDDRVALRAAELAAKRP
jgi:CobQ-like glutamine amidotransferase family enzyme